MNEIAKICLDENIEINRIEWLAASNAHHVERSLREVLTEDLTTYELGEICGMDLPEFDGDGSDAGILVELLAEAGRFGFLVLASTPVWKEGGGSWSRKSQEWFYTQTMDVAFIQRVVEWKRKDEERRKDAVTEG